MLTAALTAKLNTKTKNSEQTLDVLLYAARPMQNSKWWACRQEEEK
jgi:hypothetical protein